MGLSMRLGQRKNGSFRTWGPVDTCSGILAGGMYSQSSQELTQGLEIYWLGNASITTRILNAFRVLEGRIPCNGQDRQVRKMLLPARPMNQCEAVLAAQVNVQEHCFRQGFRRNEYESRFESVSECNFKAFVFQPAAQEFAKHRVIFNDENAMLHLVSRGW